MALNWNVLGGVGLGIQKGAEELRAQGAAKRDEEKFGLEKERAAREAEDFEYTKTQRAEAGEINARRKEVMAQSKAIQDLIAKGDLRGAYSIMQPYYNSSVDDGFKAPNPEYIREDGSFDITDYEGNNIKTMKLSPELLMDTLEGYTAMGMSSTGSVDDWKYALERSAAKRAAAAAQKNADRDFGLRKDEFKAGREDAKYTKEFNMQKFQEDIRQFGIETALKRAQIAASTARTARPPRFKMIDGEDGIQYEYQEGSGKPAAPIMGIDGKAVKRSTKIDPNSREAAVNKKGIEALLENVDPADIEAFLANMGDPADRLRGN